MKRSKLLCLIKISTAAMTAIAGAAAAAAAAVTIPH